MIQNVLLSVILLGQNSSQGESHIFDLAELFARETSQLQFSSKSGNFRGRIHRQHEWDIVEEFVQRSGGQIQNRTKPSRDFLLRQQKKIKKRLKKDIPVEIKDGKLLLTGHISLRERKALSEVFSGIEFQEPASPPPSKETVFLELALVEVRKKALRNLGLRFGSPISFDTSVFPQLLRNSSDMVQIGGFNPIGSFLDFALEEGEAKMLSKQSLVTQNLKEARFRAGGEYHVRTSGWTQGGDKYGGIETIRYEMLLQFKPKILNEGQLHIEVKAHLQEPDFSAGIGELPLIHHKEFSTQFRADFDQTMAIGGLIQSSQGQNAHKIPGVENIPVLGRLFSSESFQNQQSEAYVFVTPRLLEN